MSNAPFQTDPVRTAIAIAYQNRAYVADMVSPRAPVGAEEYKWTEYNKEDRFTLPDTTIDRKGEMNQVEFGGTEKTGMTNDWGLEDVVPTKDVEAAANTNFDPISNATELLTDLILLDREVRVANMVQDANLYPAANKETLAVGDRWGAGTSDPLTQLSDAMEVPFMRPNRMLINSASLLALRRNDAMVRSFHGNTGTDGMVPIQHILDLLELEQIIVGRARINSSAKGQAMTLQEIWGNIALLFYANPAAMPNKGLTFSLSPEYGQRVMRSKFDEDVGLRGATRVQVGESVDEIILAADTAYLFESVL